MFPGYGELTGQGIKVIPLYLFFYIAQSVPYVVAVIFAQALKGYKHPDWLACLTLAAYGYLFGIAIPPWAFLLGIQIEPWISPVLLSWLLIFPVVTLRALIIPGWNWWDAMRLALLQMIATLVAWMLFGCIVFID